MRAPFTVLKRSLLGFGEITKFPTIAFLRKQGTRVSIENEKEVAMGGRRRRNTTYHTIVFKLGFRHLSSFVNTRRPGLRQYLIYNVDDPVRPDVYTPVQVGHGVVYNRFAEMASIPSV